MKKTKKEIPDLLITVYDRKTGESIGWTNSSNEGKKTYKYNEKGQIATIDTDKGIVKYSYNDNGNVSKKVNEDGRVDIYTYDDLNQLTKLDKDNLPMIISMMQKKKESLKFGQIRKTIIMINGIIIANH